MDERVPREGFGAAALAVSAASAGKAHESVAAVPYFRGDESEAADA